MAVKNELEKNKRNISLLSIAGTALSQLTTFIEVSVAGIKDAAQACQILYWNRIAKKVLGQHAPFFQVSD
jgi:hypothetical protein